MCAELGPEAAARSSGEYTNKLPVSYALAAAGLRAPPPPPPLPPVSDEPGGRTARGRLTEGMIAHFYSCVVFVRVFSILLRALLMLSRCSRQVSARRRATRESRAA